MIYIVVDVCGDLRKFTYIKFLIWTMYTSTRSTTTYTNTPHTVPHVSIIACSIIIIIIVLFNYHLCHTHRAGASLSIEVYKSTIARESWVADSLKYDRSKIQSLHKNGAGTFPCPSLCIGCSVWLERLVLASGLAEGVQPPPVNTISSAKRGNVTVYSHHTVTGQILPF